MMLKRVTGALVEILEGVGPTTRGKPFACPETLAEKLLKDGTERFERADLAVAAKPKGE